MLSQILIDWTSNKKSLQKKLFEPSQTHYRLRWFNTTDTQPIEKVSRNLFLNNYQNKQNYVYLSFEGLIALSMIFSRLEFIVTNENRYDLQPVY